MNVWKTFTSVKIQGCVPTKFTAEQRERERHEGSVEVKRKKKKRSVEEADVSEMAKS